MNRFGAAEAPRISVKIVTYNHERFIGQALDSVFAQRVQHPLEVVIGDDGSTDATPRILRAYEERHPKQIRLLLSEVNRGWRHNTRRTLSACRGEYIAILDGDDYWTDADKLQKQVDFFERNPDCTICFHNALRVFEDGSQPAVYHRDPLAELMTIESVLHENLMPSSSIVLRNRLFDAFPAVFDSVPYNDWPLQLLCAERGRVGYLHDVMGVHRYHDGGAWTAGGDRSLAIRLRQHRWRTLFYEAADEHLDGAYHALIRRRIWSARADLLGGELKRMVRLPRRALGSWRS